MLKKFLISSIILTSQLIADNSYNDIEYMIDKVNNKRTVMVLQDLKDKYSKNSKDYEILQYVEKYFMKKLPVDAYGTYTRMKLHNVIDRSLKEERKKKEKNIIISPDTDLNYLYIQREKNMVNMENNIEDRKIGEGSGSGVLGIPGLSEDKFMEQYNKMKKNGEL